MTDSEIEKKCALAMGLRFDRRWAKGPVSVLPNKTNNRKRYRYNPLRDDAQAMALVKKLELCIERTGLIASGTETWIVHAFCLVNGSDGWTEHTDLNRAICECVASMDSGGPIDSTNK